MTLMKSYGASYIEFIKISRAAAPLQCTGSINLGSPAPIDILFFEQPCFNKNQKSSPVLFCIKVIDFSVRHVNMYLDKKLTSRPHKCHAQMVLLLSRYGTL